MSVASFAPSSSSQCLTSPASADGGRKVGVPTMGGLRYDPGAYRADLRQSVGPGQYVLAAISPHCHTCLPSDPRVSAGTGGAVGTCAPTMPLVDVESDLHNISRPATNAPCGMYRGDGGAPIVCGTPVGAGATRPQQGMPMACDGIPTVDTRLINPPCTLRGTGWNRFEWLCRDPQARALLPFDACVDTSLVIKDNHRPFVARPLDPTLALPPGGNADPSVGAPQWIPCNGAVGSSGEPPCMLWSGCEDVARSRAVPS